MNLVREHLVIIYLVLKALFTFFLSIYRFSLLDSGSLRYFIKIINPTQTRISGGSIATIKKVPRITLLSNSGIPTTSYWKEKKKNMIIPDKKLLPANPNKIYAIFFFFILVFIQKQKYKNLIKWNLYNQKLFH